MAVSYKRLFLRWETLRGWVPALLFTVIALGIELIYFTYVVSRGLVDKIVSVPLGPWQLPLSIALLLSLGNVVLLLTLWMSVFQSTAYARVGPDRQVRRVLYPLRMVRVATLVLAPFTLLLFGPYVVTTSWFARSANSVSGSIPQVVSFYNWAFGVSRIDSSVRFIISQLVAAFGAVVLGTVQLWRVKGTRRLMLLLRKRR